MNNVDKFPLSPLAQRFVLHWGEMGSRWGVNRTVGQIHALLYITARPMHAEEISETLEVARSNVSNSIKELQGWSLVRTVHLLGDRRDHFETSGDVWELFRTIVAERKSREFDPTMHVLKELVGEAKGESAEVRRRLTGLSEFMKTIGAWSDEMIKLEPATLTKIMKLGARIQSMLRAKP